MVAPINGFDPRDFTCVFKRYNEHQNPWEQVVIGARLDVDRAGQGAHTDIDVATLIIATRNGAVDTEAIVGDVEQVEALIRVLQVAKAKLELLRTTQEVEQLERKLQVDIKPL